MENTRPQPCGQADVQDAFHLEAVRDDAGRKALFARMCREGLTGCAMYAWPHPREDDWLHLVSAPGRLLLQATAPDGTALACGLFSPWRGRIREFDFTVFRTAFPLAVPLARRGVHMDGIQLLCTPETLARAIKMSPSGHRAHP
ncbi:MAG: hypothetical protein MSH27_02730 [Desulfovibrio piger]|uniref:hypothetical protein n=1 Tax=Desulfovibrio piger TaxID=901 RepID=UPI0026EDDA3A|nr:hypothetical protein [Desulfovibrio piger]MCI7373037.1 hypothetical protein [Desulfovibrio piger]